MIIFPWTPPEIATARRAVWQRRKQFKLQTRISRMVTGADREGLDKRRIGLVLLTAARGLGATEE